MARFQSTLPVRGATAVKAGDVAPLIFQSTLPVRGATFTGVQVPDGSQEISIHAPREGSDLVA